MEGLAVRILAVPRKASKPRQKLEVPELGRWVRTVRQYRKRSQKQVAEATGIDKAQISRIEAGWNCEVEQYEAIARALHYRSALDMFRSPGDPIMRRVQRYWPLLDAAARRDVLEQVKASIDAERESDATSGEEPDDGV